MLYTQLDDSYIIRLEDEEVFPDRLLEFLSTKDVRGGSFTAIGAMKRTCLAFFDVEAKEYRDRKIDEQVEVLALVGNVGLHEGKPIVHAHITLGRADYSVLGGHLRYGVVRPTLEVVLAVTTTASHASAAELTRKIDPRYGLPGLDLDHRF
jgi:predicted DNA-binding protein with PD1-like motif